MIKFLHISDMHFGVSLSSKTPLLRDQLIKALNDSYVSIIDYVIDNEIDGLIIAGDFFDSNEISYKQNYEILKGFERLIHNQKYILYISGNHDYGDLGIVYEELVRSDYFIEFDDEIGAFETVINDQKVVFHGISHHQEIVTSNSIADFPPKIDKDVHIGIFHSMVVNAKSLDNDYMYMPCKVEDLEKLNYDYIALGHVHIMQQIASGNIYYSGNPQGLKTKETGDKGGLLITIDKGFTKTDFVSFNHIQFEKIDYNLTGIIEFNELIMQLKRLAKDKVQQICDKKLVLIIELSGKASFYNELRHEFKDIEDIINETQNVVETIIKFDDVSKLEMPDIPQNSFLDFVLSNIENDKNELLRVINNQDLFNEVADIDIDVIKKDLLQFFVEA